MSNRLDPVVAPSGLSRYAALASALRERILAGEWRPGGALPAEQQLARDQGVALGTLRQALDLLAEQGLIERRHGRGTFVRAGLSGAPMLRFFRFGQRDAPTPASRIVSRRVLMARGAVALALGIEVGAAVLHLRRVRLLDGQACLVEDIDLPLARFGALAEGLTHDWGDLLYPLFAERCDVHVHRVVDTITFGAMSTNQARTLGLPAGHPAARVQRRAFDLAGQCVESRLTVGDAHAFEYTATIT